MSHASDEGLPKCNHSVGKGKNGILSAKFFMIYPVKRSGNERKRY